MNMNDLKDLPALSIRQPWAFMILHMGKDVENRGWQTHYRGRFLIHAAKGCTRDEYANATHFACHARAEKYQDMAVPPLNQLARGGIVGIAEITDCVAASDSPWHCDLAYGFVLRNARPMPFTPCRGKLRFFYPKFPQ